VKIDLVSYTKAGDTTKCSDRINFAGTPGYLVATAIDYVPEFRRKNQKCPLLCSCVGAKVLQNNTINVLSSKKVQHFATWKHGMFFALALNSVFR